MIFSKIRPATPMTLRLVFALVTALLANTGLAESPAKIKPDARPDAKPLREFIYYPNYAQSPYNYQSTGDFAMTPMVIPPSVPVLRQPSAMIVDAPPLGSGAPPGGVGLELPPPPSMPRVAAAAGPAFVGGGIPGQPGKGYSLHVGSSIDAAHADLLMQQVTTAGIPAYRRPMSYNGLNWEQIHAGPFESYEKVTQVAKLLQDQLQIQGRIVTH
ncbi:MAG: SPOR domain-containing protein [Magnetococcales bacterium]|nr:SPOR domain-containing protein [Magnetococcales bacterium]